MNEISSRKEISTAWAGVAVTALLTVYQRYLDTRRKHPYLDDQWPATVVDRISFDFAQFDQMGPFGGYALTALRCRMMDDWVRLFIAANPTGIVVDLGAGLDSRAFRINPPQGYRWFDVDLPAVTAVADDIYPELPRHRRIAASVTDGSWLQELPTDRPAVIVADGLYGFLDSDRIRSLFARIVDHLPAGELIFNSYGPLVLKKSQPVFDKYGVQITWTIDGPEEIEQLEPRLRLLAERSQFADPLLRQAPAACRLMCAMIRLSRSAATSTRILRLGFGEPLQESR